jgi:dephospho-CoA kinase
VSELLRIAGIPVYDCDSEARRLMNTSPSLREALTALAGEDVYASDSHLNRCYLADFMFGHPERVKAVNALVHPAVREDFCAWAERQEGADVVGVESAILFEAGMREDVDVTVLVFTPRAERIQRAMARDGATEESVRARLASQMPDVEKIPLVDFIIRNAEADAITPQVMELIKELKNYKIRN